MGWVAWFLMAVTAAQAQVAPQGLLLQGRLVRPDGSSVDATSVDFMLQVRSPGTENCILFEEMHTLNMSGSDGVFSVRIGSGTRTGTNFKDTSTLKQVFNNNQGSISSLNCVSGSSFAPNSGDARKLRISFDEGTGLQTLAQDQLVGSVPYALLADTLQGKSPSDFLGTIAALEGTPGTTQTRVDRVFNTDYSVLDALLNGTSTLYSKGTPTAAVDYNNQRLINVADPTSAQDAATKNYADTKIGAKTVDLTGVGSGTGDGKVLTWDATNNKWVVSSPSADATKLPLAGGTMAGDINMAGNNILAAGHVQLGLQKTLLLGRYTTTEETTLIGTLVAADAGRVWYNTTTGKQRYWNGTTANDISSTNIGTAAGQAMGADAVPHCTSSQKLEISLGPSYAWSCVTDGSQWVTSGSNIGYTTGNVGIGTTVPTALLQVYHVPTAYPAGASVSGAHFIAASVGDSGGTSDIRAVSSDVYANGTNNVANVQGFTANAYGNLTSGTIAQATGVGGVVRNSNAGTITIGSGFSAIPVLSAAGGITYYRAFNSRPPSITGAGGIGTAYGLYLDTLKITGVSTAYGVYQTGASDTNYFAGNVGIGTTAPNASYKLDVNGAINATSIKVNGVDVATGTGSQWTTSSSNIGYTTGNVGIGTTAPTNKLDIAGGMVIGTSYAGVATAPTSGLLVGGAVGIGTSVPSEKLEVYGNIKTAYGYGLITSTNSVTPVITTSRSDATAPGYLYSDGWGNFAFSKALAINSSISMVGTGTALYVNGNAGIGTTAPALKLETTGTGGMPATTGTTQTGIARFGVSSASNIVLDIGANTGTGTWFQSTNRTDLSLNYNILLNPNGGNVGIGTTAPASALHVVSTTAGEGRNYIDSYGGASGGIPGFITRSTRGTASAPTALASGDSIGFWSGRGYGATGFASGSRASIGMFASETWTDAAQGSFMTFSTTPLGTASSSERMRIDNAGNVGIGTTLPTMPLDVVKNINGISAISMTNPNAGTAATAQMNVSNGTSGASFGVSGTGYSTWGAIAANDAVVYGDNAVAITSYGGAIKFGTSSGGVIERMRVTPTGNVGIGTTDPLLGFTLGNASIRALGIGGDGTDSAGSRGNLFLANNRATATSGDALGSIVFRSVNNPGATNDFGNVATISSNLEGTGGTSGFGGYLNFATKSDNGGRVERMRITGSGNVGIGTTAPGYKQEVAATSGNVISAVTNSGTTGYAMMLAGNDAGAFTTMGSYGSANGVVAWRNNGALTTTNSLYLIANGSVSNSGSGAMYFLTGGYNPATQTRMTIDSTGNVGIGVAPSYKLDVDGDIRIAAGSKLYVGTTATCDSTGCTASPSDLRYKENITPLEDPLSKILQIQGVSYDWINKQAFNDRHQIGVIAQDVEKIYPEVVKTDEKTGFKSVMYDKLVAPLIEAFKTLYARMTAIETRQDEQARELAAIKSYLCEKEPDSKFCKSSRP